MSSRCTHTHFLSLSLNQVNHSTAALSHKHNTHHNMVPDSIPWVGQSCIYHIAPPQVEFVQYNPMDSLQSLVVWGKRRVRTEYHPTNPVLFLVWSFEWPVASTFLRRPPWWCERWDGVRRGGVCESERAMTWYY